MAYVRVLGGLTVLGGGCLAYAVAQTHHVGVNSIEYEVQCVLGVKHYVTKFGTYYLLYRALQLNTMI